MAQSTLYSSHTILTRPSPKRSRLSLKHNKHMPQEYSNVTESFNSESRTEKTVIGEKDFVQNNSVSTREKSMPLNSSFLLSTDLQLPEVMDISEDKIFAPGLPNCGNTCYINSILQVLRYTPKFLNCIHLSLLLQTQFSKIASYEAAKETEFFLKLHTLYIAMKRREVLAKKSDKNSPGALLRPVKSFLISLREMSSLFTEGEQHDAHELLLTVISMFSSFHNKIKCQRSSNSVALESKIFELSFKDSAADKEQMKIKAVKRRQRCNIPLNGVSLISINITDIDLGFEGKIRRCIKCLECEKRLERIEVFTNLEVYIDDNLVSEDTVDLIQCLCKGTLLHDENKFFCDECCHLNEAQISSDIVLPPSILLMHCSWIKSSSNISEVEKDCTKVHIPLSLNTSENTDIFCCTQDENYSLYAVVLHLGKSTEGGHYVSFVKDTSPMVGCKNSKRNTFNAEMCCETEEIINFKILSSTDNRWLLFDDEEVSAVHLNKSIKIFPYFDFLEITATPCMIFYFKA